MDQSNSILLLSDLSKENAPSHLESLTSLETLIKNKVRASKQQYPIPLSNTKKEPGLVGYANIYQNTNGKAEKVI
jgi:hypothetical protein